MLGIASLQHEKRLVLSFWKAHPLIPLKRALTLVFGSPGAVKKLHASDGHTPVEQCLSNVGYQQSVVSIGISNLAYN